MPVRRPVLATSPDQGRGEEGLEEISQQADPGEWTSLRVYDGEPVPLTLFKGTSGHCGRGLKKVGLYTGPATGRFFGSAIGAFLGGTFWAWESPTRATTTKRKRATTAVAMNEDMVKSDREGEEKRGSVLVRTRLVKKSVDGSKSVDELTRRCSRS